MLTKCHDYKFNMPLTAQFDIDRAIVSSKAGFRSMD